MKKIRAFTLVELVIVMIISTITLATIYTVYLLITKQYAKQSVKTEALNNYLIFRTALTSDFNKADSVLIGDNSHKLLCVQDTTLVSYEFLENTVIRIAANAADSFHCGSGLSTITFVDNSNLINKIRVPVIPFTDTVSFLLEKEYDAMTLIKNAK